MHLYTLCSEFSTDLTNGSTQCFLKKQIISRELFRWLTHQQHPTSCISLWGVLITSVVQTLRLPDNKNCSGCLPWYWNNTGKSEHRFWSGALEKQLPPPCLYATLYPLLIPGFCPLIVRCLSSWMVLQKKESRPLLDFRDTEAHRHLKLIMSNNSDVSNQGSSSNILNKSNHHLDIKSAWYLAHTTAGFVSQLFPSFDNFVNLQPLACFWSPLHDNLNDNSAISLLSIKCLFLLFLDLLPLKSPTLSSLF